MTLSNYPNGFTGGLTVRGVPIDIPNPGKSFWVNNSTTATHLAPGGVGGSNGNPGTYQKPFKTIDYAVGKCSAGRGDVIYVMPNHSETLSTAAAGVGALDLDVAGVTVIGLGSGSSRPRLDYTVAAGATTVSADNVTLHNLNFHANAPEILIGISTGTSENFTISNCLFDNETPETDEFMSCIAIGVAPGHVIEDCVFDMSNGNATDAILMIGCTGAIIRRNIITGDYSTANIDCTGTLSSDIHIQDNTIINGESILMGTQPCIEMVTQSLGTISGNYLASNIAVSHAAMIVADGMVNFNNWTCDDIDGTAHPASPFYLTTSITASDDG